MTLSSAAEQLGELGRAVARSRTAIADGALVELEGLDTEVARLADVARGAPSSERTHILAALDMLLFELDGLAVDLRRQRGGGLAQQATAAYRSEPGTG